MHVERILEPSSIAIIGASDREGSVGYALLKNVLEGGYKGKVIPINPRKDYVLGLKAYPSILEVDTHVDLAIIVVSAQRSMDVLDQCIAKGVGGVIVIPSGFKEAGDEGRKLEFKLRKKALENNLPLLGPNCFGVVNTSISLNATFSLDKPERGNIAFLSQSGATTALFMDLALQRHMGFSKIVTLGNRAVLNEVHFLRYLKDDDQTDIILLYVESIEDIDAFRETVSQLGKPLVVLKAGRTQEGFRAVSSHTGSLSGKDEFYKSLFKQLNIVQVDTLNELLNTAFAFQNYEPPKGRSIAIITNAGGPGINATDICVKQGFSIAKLGRRTVEKLASILPPFASLENPIDITAQGYTDEYISSIEALVEDENVDAVLSIVVRNAMYNMDETAKRIHENFRSSPKPVMTILVGRGSPYFTYPEEAILSLRKLYEHATRPKRKIRIEPKEYDSTKMDFETLKHFSIDVPRYTYIETLSEALEFARNVGYPLVLKVTQFVHKTDVGGVVLNIWNDEQLEQAYTQLRKVQPEGNLLVQSMVHSGLEFILGAISDEHFGKVVMLGMGGILAEIFKDVSFGILPLYVEDVESMLRELRIYRYLDNLRGRRYPKDKLLETVVNFVSMVESLDFKEMEINPLIVNEHGCFAVDFRSIQT